ncbi:MAG: hypothetical protein WA843_01805 [Candidatus Saccharimonadales bacterium]
MSSIENLVPRQYNGDSIAWLADLSARQTELDEARRLLEKESYAAKWADEFDQTLERGGAATSPFPYDFHGVWRLAPSQAGDNPYFAYTPVVVKDELPDGIEPKKRVVEVDELAVGTCARCEQSQPLLGRSESKGVGMGDVGAHTEVAIVHCGEVQLQIVTKDEQGRETSFSPHLKPYDYPELDRSSS